MNEFLGRMGLNVYEKKLRKNALLYRMKGHIDCPTGLSLSPDGSYIASNAMDNTGKIL